MTLQEYFTALAGESATLHAAIPTLLEAQDESMVEQERIKREEYRQRCQKLSNAASDQIAELDKMKRNLRDFRADQAIDVDKLTSRFFDILRERKSNNLPR